MNPLSQNEAFALLLLLSTNSNLVADLNLKLANAASSDAFFQAFSATLTAAPFQIDPTKIQKARMQHLWTQNGGAKRATLDTSTHSVGLALAPTIVYDPGPCPDANQEQLIWNKLVNA